MDRVGGIEEATGVCAETKIEELAERKLRFDKPELAQQWDEIQRRERQAAIPKIEQSQSGGVRAFGGRQPLFKYRPMHTVVISYSSEDKAVAFDACKALEGGGIKCWIAPRDVMPGHPYSSQITETIRKAKAFVLVLSQKSNRSRDVLREVERAAHSRLHLIAFQIEDFEPSDDLGYFLSVEHWLNAFEGVSPETHFPELLQHTSALVREGVSEVQGEQTKPRPGAQPAGTEKFANYHLGKRGLIWASRP